MEILNSDSSTRAEKDEQSVMAVEGTFHFPFWIAFKRKHSPDSVFFNLGNVEREMLAKQVILEISEEEKLQITRLEEQQSWETVCPVVGCKAKLNGLQDLEDHYFTRHTAICCVCSHVFPTTRLLDLHVSEAHDSFFQAKAARGYPMYKCLVEGCDALFLNDASRHQHLVDKHKFPLRFHFHKKKHLSQKQRQRAHARQLSKQTEDEQPRKEVARKKGLKEGNSCQGGPDSSSLQMEVDDLTSAVSRLRTTEQMPSNISFGRRHNRAFAFMSRNPRGRGGSTKTRYKKDQETHSEIADGQQAS